MKNRKRRGYWTIETCKIVVESCNTIKEVEEKESGCYQTIIKNNWGFLLDHLRKSKSKNFWTKEKCEKEALRYDNIKDFRDNCSSVYVKACKEKWIEDICSHMNRNKKPEGYWTKSKCKELALQCKSIKEFKKLSRSAYFYARTNKWLEDICLHFDTLGNRTKRFIYAYEFPDNNVYVGLTYCIEKRKNEHLKRGSVFNYSQKTKLTPTFKQITLEPVNIEEAKRLEGFYLEKYISNGWIKINKNKTGSLGYGNKKWTFENLLAEAIKYKTKKEFRENNSSAYSAAKKYKLINDICKHMVCKEIKPSGYWNYENCKKEALKYKTLKEFIENSKSAYRVSNKNGWVKEFSEWYTKSKKESKYTISYCKNLVNNINTISDFKRKYPYAYKVICKNKWNNKLFKDLKR